MAPVFESTSASGLHEIACSAVHGLHRAVAGARIGSSIFIASSTISDVAFLDRVAGLDEE